MIAWMLVVLLAIAFVSRIFRSNKMLFTLVLAALLGLVVGMLSKEVVKGDSNSETTTYTQENSPKTEVNCIQFLSELYYSNDKVSHTGIVGYNSTSSDKVLGEYVKTYRTKGRDQPIEDDTS